MPDGTTKHVSIMPTMGKIIFSFCDTARAGFILMRRSFLVVKSRMSGGCITHEVRRELGRQEDGRGAVGTADDGYRAGLVGGKAEQEGHHVGTEDAKLSGRTDEHEFGVGDQGREVGHGTDAEEYQRRIPSCAHTVVEDVEHGALLIDADFESGGGVEGDVADE